MWSNDRIKNNKALGADSVVNECFKYDGYAIKIKLSKLIKCDFWKRGSTKIS